MSASFDGALKRKIKEQVEFYFSDSNAGDKFFMAKINGHPEGYVELALICCFSRMARALGLQQGIKIDLVPKMVIQKVANALRESPDLEVSRDGLFVRRKTPFESQEKILRDIDERSVYAKPLPFDCTLEALTSFFAAYGTVKAVRMRRRPDNKDFKGSCFVELDSPDAANKMAVRSDVVFEGCPLRLERKLDYQDRKKHSKTNKAAEINGVAMVDQAVNGQAVPMQEGPAPSFAPGLVLRFDIPEGVDVPAEMHYQTVKDAFGGRTEGVVFCEYNKGERQGFVRISGSEKTKNILSKRDADGHMPMAGIQVKVKLVEGDDEKLFYQRLADARRKADAERGPNDKRRPDRGRGSQTAKRGRAA